MCTFVLPLVTYRFNIHSDVSVKERDAISLMIRTHGGVVVDKGSIDYSVIPLILEEKYERSKSTPVTAVWVVSCLYSCSILKCNCYFITIS